MHQHTRFTLLRLILAAVALLPFSLSFGADDEVQLTVINNTFYYLHVILNGEPNLYIAPGRSTTLTTPVNVPTTISATAFYAPGQGVRGSATESFTIGGEVYTTDCSGSGGHSSGCTKEPLNPSTSWTVTADMLVDSTAVRAGGEVTP